MKAKPIFKVSSTLCAALLLLLAFSCSREIDGLEPADFPTGGEVFIDGFPGGLEYTAFGGSKTDAFQVDEDVAYDGEASMRFEIPDLDDPSGGYAGGAYTFPVGRDLTGFDALTFWAKASKSANIDEIGFGNDLAESKYRVVITDVAVNTNWKKYIIPIPDASKLTQERGMLWYSEGPEDGKGYTFWIDEVQFEKLGTIAHPKAAILLGNELQLTAETGDRLVVDGLTATANLPNGVDQTVFAAPGYFDFTSSDPSVASINASGVLTVIDAGTTVITAKLGEVDAEGSLTLESTGDPILPPTPAPTPQVSQDSVISMYSNVYNDVVVDTWNPFWEFSTTLVDDVKIGDDDLKRYKQLNFVGILTESAKIDATEMTHFHMDIWTPDPTDGGQTFKILLVDFGADGNFGGNDDSSHEVSFTAPTLSSGKWVSLDIPLVDFAGLVNRNNIAQLVLSGEIPNVFVDNVYYYNAGSSGRPEPTEAAPTPTVDAADVVSLFSNAYDDVPVDTWSADWDVAQLEDIQVAGDDVKLYTGLSFAGIEFTSQTVDASQLDRFHMDIWTPDPTAIPAALRIKLVDFGADGAFGGGDDVEHELAIDANTSPALATEQWVGIDLPLSAFAGLTTRANLAQMIISGDPNTLYVDNIYFYAGEGGGGGGGDTEPMVAAPAPTQSSADVVSLFSDVYDDVPVDTWRTDWSNATFEDVFVADNATKKYSALDFVGIETVANPVDASGMTHFSMDVWSPDFTVFGVKLVDFGADGAFGGGDDVEHQINFEAPIQGEWVSFDIPLADFTGLTTTSNIAQYILVGQPTAATTVFVDNVYFFNSEGGGGGGGTEPSMAAPTPTQSESDVVSVFSDAYTDVAVDTWRTDWSSATFEDVTVDGNATKKYSDLDFVGIETVSSTVDASNMTHFRMDVWSPDFTVFGIKLVDFGADGAFGGGDDAEHQINFDAPVQGEWVSFDIPLTDFTGLTTTGNIAQFILVGQPTGATTVFVDNIYFYTDGGGGMLTEPVMEAPTPTEDAANVVSLFSDAYDDVAVDTWRTDWSAATFEDITVNGNATKKYSALDFVGIETVSSPVDASNMTNFRIDVWSPDFELFGVKLVDFGADGAFGGGDDVEHQVDINMPMQGDWVSLDIPLTDFTGLTTTGNIAQFILVGRPAGATTVFVDNIYFYGEGDGGGNLTEPAEAAPAPTLAEADVISLFSDVYTDVPVDTWRTDWSSATFEDVMVAGNATKKYSALDFVGIETVANTVNASEMTHFHIDVWSADATFFGIKIVDFGADGAFGGGDDVEHQINFEAPQQGGWVSYDIPLSDFAGLTTRGNVAQYILVGQPTGANTIFVDNMYFHK